MLHPFSSCYPIIGFNCATIVLLPWRPAMQASNGRKNKCASAFCNPALAVCQSESEWVWALGVGRGTKYGDWGASAPPFLFLHAPFFWRFMDLSSQIIKYQRGSSVNFATGILSHRSSSCEFHLQGVCADFLPSEDLDRTAKLFLRSPESEVGRRKRERDRRRG